MSSPLFHANCVAAIEDEVGWVVGLADREFGATHYVQFQRAHSIDAQDRALGMDTYYVEKDDQSNSCYGGIEGIFLQDSSILMKLNDAGSRSLGLGREVLITFNTDQESLDRFRRGLTTVFAGTGAFRDSSNE